MVYGKMVVIFSGYNDRAVVAFVRTLEIHKINYAIVARDEADLIFKTKYKAKVLITRTEKKLELDFFIKSILSIKNKFKLDEIFVAPSTEALIRFLLKNQRALHELNVTIPVVDQSLYQLISDKKSFSELCHRHGIDVPEEFGSLDNAIIPFVAKPKEYVSKNGEIYTPVLIFNQDEKIQFSKKHDASDFYYQGYIGGKSKYLLYYFERNGSVHKFSQENIIQQYEGKSMLAARSSEYHESKTSSKFESLFKTLGFFGLVMVELKVDENKNYMIEANPRFWGPSQLFVDAKINLFEALLFDYGFLEKCPQFEGVKDINYFWCGGFFAAIRGGDIKSICGEHEILNIDEWLKYDIYKRDDTIDLFIEELK